LIIIQGFREFAVVDISVSSMPMLIILTVTMIKDGVEDLKRWRSDKEINSRTTLTLNNWVNSNYNENNGKKFFSKLKSLLSVPRIIMDRMWNRERETSDGCSSTDWKKTKWAEVKVGDFILVSCDEPIPADILGNQRTNPVLSTSEADCICYVETKNLDGETNLKLRQGPVETSWLKTPLECKNNIEIIVDSENPNVNMLKYHATLFITCKGKPPLSNKDRPSRENYKVFANINNLLLRGAILRNTEWVIGIVVFTGQDTKQLRNCGQTPWKKSTLDKKMNFHM
jgi:phospholipid-translocating ATPase